MEKFCDKYTKSSKVFFSMDKFTAFFFFFFSIFQHYCQNVFLSGQLEICLYKFEFDLIICIRIPRFQLELSRTIYFSKEHIPRIIQSEQSTRLWSSSLVTSTKSLKNFTVSKTSFSAISSIIHFFSRQKFCQTHFSWS